MYTSIKCCFSPYFNSLTAVIKTKHKIVDITAYYNVIVLTKETYYTVLTITQNTGISEYKSCEQQKTRYYCTNRYTKYWTSQFVC